MTIRELPFPYKHVITFDSDVDQQYPWYGAAIHWYLNEKLGLHTSNSCWVTSARIGQSAFFVGAELNSRPVSEHDDKSTWRLLLREWHRGNIDHFHSWSHDGTFIIRYPIVDNSVEIDGPPESIGNSVYRVLRLILAEELPADSVRTCTFETVSGDEVTYPVTDANVSSCLRGEDHQRVQTLDFVVGLDIPIKGKPIANWTNVRRIYAESAVVETVEFDNITRRLLDHQAEVMRKLNVRPVYVSSHGGKTCAQNFGELQTETTGRFGHLKGGLVSERLPLADFEGSHAYHSDLLAELGTEIVWPQTWDTWRPYLQFFNESTPQFQEWRRCGLLAGWRTKVGEFIGSQLTGSGFGEALSSHTETDSGEEFASLWEECHHRSGLSGKVVFGHGAIVPLLLAISLNRIRQGFTVENLWYTHFGGGLKNRDELNSNQPFTEVGSQYWRRLAEHVHGIDSDLPRVWSPSVGSYFRFKMATQFLCDAISVEENHVEINPIRNETTGRLIPDLLAGTRDLHGVSVYVDDASKSTASVAQTPITAFSRNREDESGRQSITFLDNHCPTPLLDRIPIRELAKFSMIEVKGGLRDLRFPTLSGDRHFIMQAANGEASISYQPGSLAFWNSSHLELSVWPENPEDSYALILQMESGARIAVLKGIDSQELRVNAWWTLDDLPSTEHWLPLSALEFADETAAENMPLPVGEVSRVELVFRSKTNRRLNIERACMHRSNPDGISPDNCLVAGGRVRRGGMAVPSARIELSDIASEKVWSTVTDRQGYWLIEDLPANSLLENRCEIEKTQFCLDVGRFVDLRKNEVELNANLESDFHS